MNKEDYNSKARKRYANEENYREKRIIRARVRRKNNRIKNIVSEFRHGMSHTGTWNSWNAMKRRTRGGCSAHAKYKNMFIDPRWNRFFNFFSDMGARPEGLTLDRKDNEKGYYKDNCRWATRAEQSRNRRCNVLNEEMVRMIREEKKGMAGVIIAKELGLKADTVRRAMSGLTWKEVSHV